MQKNQSVLILIMSLSAIPAMPADLWINEFHYDNVSTDSDEFVEVSGRGCRYYR